MPADGSIELYDPPSGNYCQLNTPLQKISWQRLQWEQQLLDVQQMQFELDAAEERCRAARLEVSESGSNP